MSEKRKRTTELRVASYSDELSTVVQSTFNGLSVPSSTKFDLYKHKKQDRYVIHGENETLDYNGESSVDGEENEYIVALYDPVNRAVDLFKAPFVNSKVTARSKRVYKGPKVQQLGVRNNIQRNALGEAFGTKKAKAAITNLEKNRIDSEKLQDMEMDIVDTVQESTQDLPTRDVMAATVINDRPTPVADVDATNVEDIYPLYNIIPNHEWDYLRVDPLMQESDEAARLELLPYGNSAYVRKQLPQLVATGNTEKLQILYYISLLFGVYANRRVRDKESLMTRLDNKASEVLIDGILERFTISRSSQFGKSKDRSFLIDPHHEDKLLCYLLTLIMHLNNFMVELPPLANELNIKATKLISLFRALGAIIKAATVAQAEAFGIPKSAAATYKIASLKVPFKLPEMTRRGAKKSR